MLRHGRARLKESLQTGGESRIEAAEIKRRMGCSCDPVFAYSPKTSLNASAVTGRP